MRGVAKNYYFFVVCVLWSDVVKKALSWPSAVPPPRWTVGSLSAQPVRDCSMVGSPDLIVGLARPAKTTKKKKLRSTLPLEKRACRTRWLLLLLSTNRLHSPIQQQIDGKNSGRRHLCRHRHWRRPSAIRGNACSCPWDLWIYRLWRHTSGFGLSKSISLDGCSSF